MNGFRHFLVSNDDKSVPVKFGLKNWSLIIIKDIAVIFLPGFYWWFYSFCGEYNVDLLFYCNFAVIKMLLRNISFFKSIYIYS